jgi:hypothetical protein
MSQAKTMTYTEDLRGRCGDALSEALDAAAAAAAGVGWWALGELLGLHPQAAWESCRAASLSSAGFTRAFTFSAAAALAAAALAALMSPRATRPPEPGRPPTNPRRLSVASSAKPKIEVRYRAGVRCRKAEAAAGSASDLLRTQ